MGLASLTGTTELREYVSKCRSGGFLHYADHTVPLFQLALWLREFPKARWTFIRYEDIFDRRHTRGSTLRWLAGLFNLSDPTALPSFNHARGCDFGQSANSYVGSSFAPAASETRELRALFAPWQAQLEALIRHFAVGRGVPGIQRRPDPDGVS